MAVKIILTLCFILSTIGVLCQTNDLKEVQRNRTIAKDFARKKSFDSACSIYAKFISNKKYANPFDELEYSYCCLKRGDTAMFQRLLCKSIQSGVDTELIYRFYGQLSAVEKERTELFLKSNFVALYQTFLDTHDTVLINELTCMRQMDQMARGPIQKLIMKYRQHWEEDSNAHYLMVVQKLADSLNYIRFMRLLAQGRFPGYHLCGVAAADIGIMLLHLDGSYVDWDLVQDALKKAVVDGDLDPGQVAGIIDRHYLGLLNPVYYYGRIRWNGNYGFYDCKNVDKLRAEIGIETLRSEYLKEQRALPECYDREY